MVFLFCENKAKFSLKYRILISHLVISPQEYWKETKTNKNNRSIFLSGNNNNMFLKYWLYIVTQLLSFTFKADFSRENFTFLCKKKKDHKTRAVTDCGVCYHDYIGQGKNGYCMMYIMLFYTRFEDKSAKEGKKARKELTAEKIKIKPNARKSTNVQTCVI